MPEPARLQLAAPDRPDRVAEREAGDDVGAAADAREVHVPLDRCVDVVEAVRRERAAGREDRAERRRDRACAPGASPSFSASARYFALVPNTVIRSSAAMSHRIGGGASGAPSYSTTVAPTASARDEPVPHHPAAGGEVEDPVVRAEVGVQHQLLEMLEQRAARPVHHALGQARRAGRVHDVERMIERQAREGGLVRHRRCASSSSSQRTAPAAARCRSRLRLEVRHHDDPLDRRAVCAHTSRTRASESISLPA